MQQKSEDEWDVHFVFALHVLRDKGSNKKRHDNSRPSDGFKKSGIAGSYSASSQL